MCGIAGIYNNNKESLVQKMTDLMEHRGPDDKGFFTDEKIALGHRRLSIIDLSEKGHQPMQRDNLVIVYNGEIYNYIELRKELEQKGYIFFSDTDTEVILFAFKEWGRDCLKKFNGMWAFAIWDKNKKELFCSRDRYGIKPFYYYYNNDVFAFASEIRALLSCPFVKKEPNDKTVYEYLAAEMTDYSDHTFFKNIKQLEPSNYLLIKDKKFEKGKYYNLSFNPELGRFDSKKAEGYAEQFLLLLQDSVRLRMRSDVPVGSCLSGGLDSPAVVCLMTKFLKGEKQKTFSFYSEEFDEREYIEKVVKKAGAQDYYVSCSGENFWQDINRIVLQQEEPFKSTSIYAQWKVMELAEQNNVKVLLDGQGADEIMGYPGQAGSYFLQLFLNARIISFFQETNNINLFFNHFIRYIAPKKLVMFLRKQKIESLKYINSGLEKKYGPAEILPRGARANFNQALFEGITGSGLRRLLKYEDKNSMAFSRESRLSFLDYRLVDFVSSLPAVFKAHKGTSKYLQRLAVKNLIPAEIIARKDKMGFVTPEERWLRENKENIKQIFRRNNPYFSKEKILNKLNQKKANLSSLWRFINLELWLKGF